jgi:hypothetical protein
MRAYLHRDFHGALSIGFQYVKERYGLEALYEYWRRIAINCYEPLIDKLSNQGLEALEEHWGRVFGLEGGEYKLFYRGDTLILEVGRCPAIAHLQRKGFPIAEDFCEHTVFINRELCRQAGFETHCTFEQAKGICRQEFWAI